MHKVWFKEAIDVSELIDHASNYINNKKQLPGISSAMLALQAIEPQSPTTRSQWKDFT